MANLNRNMYVTIRCMIGRIATIDTVRIGVDKNDAESALKGLL